MANTMTGSCVACYALSPRLSAASRCPRCEARIDVLRQIPITEFERAHRATFYAQLQIRIIE